MNLFLALSLLKQQPQESVVSAVIHTYKTQFHQICHRMLSKFIVLHIFIKMQILAFSQAGKSFLLNSVKQ